MRPDGTLTHHEFAFIDGAMNRLGWLYNPETDNFEATIGSEAGEIIYWRDVIDAIPSATWGQLQAFCKRKKAEFGSYA